MLGLANFQLLSTEQQKLCYIQASKPRISSMNIPQTYFLYFYYHLCIIFSSSFKMLNRGSHVLSTLIRPAPNRPTFCAKGSEETKISTESFISSVLTSTTTTHSSIPHHHNNVLAGIENEPRCSPAEFSFLQISSGQEDCNNRCCQRPCR